MFVVPRKCSEKVVGGGVGWEGGMSIAAAMVKALVVVQRGRAN